MAVREAIIVTLLTRRRPEPQQMQIGPHSITRCPSSLRPQSTLLPPIFSITQSTKSISFSLNIFPSLPLTLIARKSSLLISSLISSLTLPSHLLYPPPLYSSVFPSLLLSSKFIASHFVSSLPDKRLSRLAAMFSDEALASLRSRRAVRTNQNNSFSSCFAAYRSHFYMPKGMSLRTQYSTL
jgi:hypothetical protein